MMINVRSIYQMPISMRNWKAADRLERLTVGTGLDAEPFPSTGGRVVFASLRFSNSIWLLPFDARGQAGTEIRRITEGTAYDATPSVSRDGTKLVFTSGRLGNRDVWIQDLKTGREAALTSTPVDEESPVISADGTKVAYTVSGQATQPIYVADARLSPGSTVPEKVCDDCGQPVDWSPDGSRIIYICGQPRAVGSFSVASGRKARVARSARYGIDQAQFAPDGAWMSVLAYIDPNHTRILAIPLRNGAAVSEDQWIPITDGASWDDRPRWSLRGNLIYFYSRRDGFGCIWKQAVDPATRKPVGPPLAMHHFHSTGLSIMHMRLDRLGLSVAADKLAFNLLEVKGNLWMMQTGKGQN
jgi:Tol biopolymer transport system component